MDRLLLSILPEALKRIEKFGYRREFVYANMEEYNNNCCKADNKIMRYSLHKLGEIELDTFIGLKIVAFLIVLNNCKFSYFFIA
jgi:hypothetical protein